MCWPAAACRAPAPSAHRQCRYGRSRQFDRHADGRRQLHRQWRHARDRGRAWRRCVADRSARRHRRHRGHDATSRSSMSAALGAQTVEGIKIVDVGGASNGIFSLLGDYVFQGEPGGDRRRLWLSAATRTAISTPDRRRLVSALERCPSHRRRPRRRRHHRRAHRPSLRRSLCRRLTEDRSSPRRCRCMRAMPA